MKTFLFLSLLVVALGIDPQEIEAEIAFQNLPHPFKVLEPHNYIRAAYIKPQEVRDRIKKATEQVEKDNDEEKYEKTMLAIAPDVYYYYNLTNYLIRQSSKGFDNAVAQEFNTKVINCGYRAVRTVVLYDSKFVEVTETLTKLKDELFNLPEEAQAEFTLHWPDVSKLFKEWHQTPTLLTAGGDTLSKVVFQRLPAELRDDATQEIISTFEHLPIEKRAEISAKIRVVPHDDLGECALLVDSVSSKLAKQFGKINKQQQTALEKSKLTTSFASDLIDEYHFELLRALRGEAAFTDGPKKLFQAEFNSLTTEGKAEFKELFPTFNTYFEAHASEVQPLTPRERAELAFGKLPRIYQWRSLFDVMLAYEELDVHVKTILAEHVHVWKETGDVNQFFALVLQDLVVPSSPPTEVSSSPPSALGLGGLLGGLMKPAAGPAAAPAAAIQPFRDYGDPGQYDNILHGMIVKVIQMLTETPSKLLNFLLQGIISIVQSLFGGGGPGEIAPIGGGPQPVGGFGSKSASSFDLKEDEAVAAYNKLSASDKQTVNEQIYFSAPVVNITEDADHQNFQQLPSHQQVDVIYTRLPALLQIDQVNVLLHVLFKLDVFSRLRITEIAEDTKTYNTWEKFVVAVKEENMLLGLKLRQVEKQLAKTAGDKKTVALTAVRTLFTTASAHLTSVVSQLTSVGTNLLVDVGTAVGTAVKTTATILPIFG